MTNECERSLKMVSLRCCAMQFRKWRGSVRVIMVFVFLTIFSYDAYSTILSFSRATATFVTPWVYPHIFSDRYLMMCICFSVMVLFCDAPFIDRHQPYIIIRSGRIHWALGTVAYLLFSSVMVSLSLWIIGLFIGIGTTTWSLDWGNVLSSAANFSIISPQIMEQYTPIGASILALALSSLIFFFLGLLFFLCNLLFPAGVGTIIVGAFCVLDFFSLFFLQDTLWILRLSPVSWANLELLGTSGWPSIFYAFAALAVINLTLIGGILAKCKTMDILVTQYESGR